MHSSTSGHATDIRVVYWSGRRTSPVHVQVIYGLLIAPVGVPHPALNE